jgi:HAMP domain-containing protein
MKFSLISTSTKVAAVLAIALVLSLWGNLHQYVSKRVGIAEAVAAGFAQAAKTNADIANDEASDTKKLVADLRAIAERGQQTRVVYQKAAAKKPLAAVCAPGNDRINAVNAGADR